MSTENNLTEKQLKKREYNKRAREKAKMKKLETTPSIENVSFTTDMSNASIEDKDPDPTNNEVTMDKETYEYLINMVKKSQDVKPTVVKEKETVVEKREEKSDEVNFQKATGPTFMNQVKQNAVGLVASVVPILMMQGVIHGAKYMRSQGSQHSASEPYVMPKSTVDPYSMNHY